MYYVSSAGPASLRQLCVAVRLDALSGSHRIAGASGGRHREHAERRIRRRHRAWDGFEAPQDGTDANTARSGAVPAHPAKCGSAAGSHALPAASGRHCPRRFSTGRRSAKRGNLESMHAPKIRVENGRIKLDEPTDLPNGTELYIVPAAELDDVVLLRDDGLDDEERKRLHESIRRGIADGRAGRVTDFDEFLTELETER